MNQVSVRSATPDDAPFLIPLITESSGGVWPLVWQATSVGSETTKASGIRYLQNTTNQLSVANTIIAEVKGEPAGTLICYRESVQTADDTTSAENLQPLPSSLQQILRPYRELSDSDSWFIAELCLLPAARGKGIGTVLLEVAQKTAGDNHLPRLSLRVFSENTGAVRLYELFGFSVVDRRDVVPHPEIVVTGEVFLMTMPVN